MAGNQLPMPGGEQRDQTKFIVFENFEKMNTQPIRQSLSEKQLAWLENLQPIAGNNYAAIPGPAAIALANITGGGVVISEMFFAVLNEVDYIVVFTNLGSGYLVTISNGNVNHFAPDGTFSVHPDVTTWQASRLLIADPIAGYGTFDGTIFVGQGGVSPNITVTNGGSGYGTAPSVTITGGSGTGATAHAVVQNGQVIQVVLDNPGHGYQVGDVLTVNFGTSAGSGAAAHVTMTGFPVAGLSVGRGGAFNSVGAGNHQLSFSGGGGTGARGFATVAVFSPGTNFVQSVTLTSAGSGYTSVPSAILSTNNLSPIINVFLGTETVATIVLDAGGSAYTGPPSVSVVPSDGIGSGTAAVSTEAGGAVTSVSLVASAVATLSIAYQGVSSTPGVFALAFSGGGGTGATGTATIGNYTDDTGGTSIGVIGMALTGGGTGYTTAPTVTVTGATFSAGPVLFAFIVSQGGGYDLTPNVFFGSGSGATAEAHVWPFINSSIAGDAFTTLAVFQGRVWLAGGNLLTWTGTGASYGNVGYDDFLSADASDSLIISDADLIHAITALRAYNNYLFIMGDQSVKQIGNISLNQAGDVTLFTILTLSSDQGTIYPKSCISYNRVFMFANTNGIYGVFGSSVQKLSSDLDGIWKNLTTVNDILPQGAVADINSIHNAVFLIPYTDPSVGLFNRIMVVFDSKQWFVVKPGSSFVVAIVTTADLGSGKLSLYGTLANSDITKLLASPTLPVTFKMQTSLTHHGNAVQRKRLIAAGFSYNLAGLTVASATVAAGGGSGTNGTVLLTVGGGTGTAATLSGTIAAGVLTGSLIVVSGGVYSVFPTSPAAVTGGGLVGAAVNLVQLTSSVTETVEATNQSVAITVPTVVGFHSPGGVASVGGAGKYLGMTITGTLAGFTMVNLEMEYQESELWRDS